MACVPERNASRGVAGAAGRVGIVMGAIGTAASGVALPSGLAPGLKSEPGPCSGTATVAPSGVRVPSKLTAGESPTAKASNPRLTMRLDGRITHHLGGTVHLTDAESTGRSRAPACDQGDLPTRALSVKSYGGTALRPFVMDYEHFAFPVLLVLDRREARFLPVKAARRADKLQVRQPGNLCCRAMRREVALEPDDTAGGGERLVDGVDHGLVLVPLHPLEVLGNDTPRTVVEQRPHQERNATSFQQVFGNITAGGFQIRNTPCPFDDFGWPVPPVGDVPAGKLRLQIELGVHVSASRRISIQTTNPVFRS